MSWWLSPSGWPMHADTAEGDEAFEALGYTAIDASQVQAAVDAYHAGTPANGVDELDAAITALQKDPASQFYAAQRAAIDAEALPRWKASTAYAAGDPVLNPSGQIVTANAAFTSGASYDGTKWTVVSGGGGGGSTSPATTTSQGTVQLAGDLGGTATAPTVVGGTHHGHTAAQISDASTVGKNVLTAADAATARTAIGAGTSSFSGSYTDLTNQPTIPSQYTDGEAVSAVEAAATVAPTGAWNFSQTPTVNGTALGSGGGGSASYPNSSGSATVVPRPMFIDARDYGAKFDSTTDDTAAIQAALDAAVIPATGVSNPNDLRATIVQLPPGGAKLTAPLQIPANCWLRGHGPSATYLSQSDPTLDTLNNKPSTVQVTISDLGIIGAASPTAGAGIDLSNTGGASGLGDSRNIIRDVVIIGPYKGIHNIGGSEGRIERVTVQRPVNIGIETVATDFFLVNCTVGQPGDTGIMLNGANGRVWGCKVFGGGTGGATKAFRVSGSGRHEISTCEVQDFNGDAFYIEAWDCTLSSCLSDSNSGAGFNLDGGVGVTNIAGGMVFNRGGAYNQQVGVRAFYVVGSHIDVIVGTGIPEFLTDGSGTLSAVNISNERGPQNVTYAASIAPNPFNGGSVYVGTLTGDIAINGYNVSPNVPHERFHPGQRLAFLLTQDATGGHAVTFDSTFQTSATAIPTTASSSTRIEFEWTGSIWREVTRSTI